MKKRLSAVATLALMALAPALHAQTAHDAEVIAGVDAVKWQDAPAIFPKGMKIAYLYGDVTKHAPFTLRVMMPAHSVIAPHTHNLDEMLTLISGSVDHYVGNTMDDAHAHHITAGGFVHLPVNMAHALKAGDEPAVAQVSGVGPFQMKYVNPKDDPRNTP